MSKSQDAFRTISEVSDVLDTPAHVLRFWESKFSQVKPVKRAGGRRYYRPTDVDLLAGIKKLLHVDGMTIKGAQKLMREHGVKHVCAIGADIMGSDDERGVAAIEHETPAAPPPAAKTSAPQAKAPVQATVETPEPAAAKTKPETDTTSANVVPLQAAPDPPAPSVEESPSEPPARAADADADADADNISPAAAAMPDVPADPSDSDSKAPARLFHLLRDAPPDALHARAADIAPLLARMRTLRGRISLR